MLITKILLHATQLRSKYGSFTSLMRALLTRDARAEMWAQRLWITVSRRCGTRRAHGIDFPIRTQRYGVYQIGEV